MGVVGKGWYARFAVVMAVVAALLLGLRYYRRYAKQRQQVAAVADMTEAAEALVGFLRSDLPEAWSIERVTDYHSLRGVTYSWIAEWDRLVDRILAVKQRLEKVRLWASAGFSREPGYWQYDAPGWRRRGVELAQRIRGLDESITSMREHVGLDPRPLRLGGEPLHLMLPIPIAGPGQRSPFRGVWLRERGVMVLSQERWERDRAWLLTIDWSGRSGTPLALAGPVQHLLNWAVTGAGTLCGIGVRYVEEGGRYQRYRMLACYGEGATRARFALDLDWIDDGEQRTDIWGGDTHVVVRVGDGFVAVSADGVMRAVARPPRAIQTVRSRESSGPRDPELEWFTMPDHGTLTFDSGKDWDRELMVGRADQESRRSRVALLREGSWLEQVVSDDLGRVVAIISDRANRWSMVLSRDAGLTWRGALRGACDENQWCEAPEKSCADDLDNDSDGLVDCEDPDCDSICPACTDDECERSLCNSDEDKDCSLDRLGDGACDCGCQFCDLDCDACKESARATGLEPGD